MHLFSKERAQALLRTADIQIDGTRPWDVTIYNDKIYRRVALGGSLAVGESYMDGWWDTPALDQFCEHIMRGRVQHSLSELAMLPYRMRAKFSNMQSKARARKVAEAHYDLGNDLYEAMLDSRMIYTSGYWSSPTHPATNLDAAQEAKLDLICRKIGLKAGQVVLDIGCGWGGFLKFAAEKYGARGVGITVSKEQLALAEERCAGLPIEFRLQDYRDVTGSFDHVVSIEMIEAVGYKNFNVYFKKAHEVLKEGGFFLLQAIGAQYTSQTTDPWIDTYIFPNGMLPSATQIAQATDRLFVIEDVHNFGPDYDKTLMAWFENFDRAWPSLREKYGERFYRMWKYYLLCCAGLFRSRQNQLWQIVFSKGGTPGGYSTVR